MRKVCLALNYADPIGETTVLNIRLDFKHLCNRFRLEDAATNWLAVRSGYSRGHKAGKIRNSTVRAADRLTGQLEVARFFLLRVVGRRGAFFQLGCPGPLQTESPKGLVTSRCMNAANDSLMTSSRTI